MTRVELVPAVAATKCAECGQDTAQEVVLTNQNGLVLLRAKSCPACGERRHRQEIDDAVPAPRLSV